ncbi:hypothetical protein BEN71_15550 [Acinetobacter wuhouensis]|uniref:Uncharacterized protein n=1 Tax=Acinetobacter wuhouensis TaxID=1879050 RepID=A0A385C6P9_9GAMM|nr:hypothetical protein [Acinetobacter wuhouensis]AXQ23401.1 hypothetical protein BEN71_15550 [Acinetobacter wuhouensis]RZG43566.1 hypothetical protein EXU28_17150 [Acinetobacter wuhouensis]RZG70319.1 hypothetical protein EXU29_16455 [Acinetobacter wuhouensis]
MESYSYWITVYSFVFSILIASLSLNSIFFIKDKINRILAFISFSGLYSLILSYFFAKSWMGYLEQNFVYKFIYEGFSSHLFHGNFYLIFSLIIFIILVIRLFMTRYKKVMLK